VNIVDAAAAADVAAAAASCHSAYADCAAAAATTTTRATAPAPAAAVPATAAPATGLDAAAGIRYPADGIRGSTDGISQLWPAATVELSSTTCSLLPSAATMGIRPGSSGCLSSLGRPYTLCLAIPDVSYLSKSPSAYPYPGDMCQWNASKPKQSTQTRNADSTSVGLPLQPLRRRLSRLHLKPRRSQLSLRPSYRVLRSAEAAMTAGASLIGLARRARRARRPKRPTIPWPSQGFLDSRGKRENY